jgi:hypothetical protein
VISLSRSSGSAGLSGGSKPVRCWTGSEAARAARRYWLVENRGLCLILALTAGIIGERHGLDWSSD